MNLISAFPPDLLNSLQPAVPKPLSHWKNNCWNLCLMDKFISAKIPYNIFSLISSKTVKTRSTLLPSVKGSTKQLEMTACEPGLGQGGAPSGQPAPRARGSVLAPCLWVCTQYQFWFFGEEGLKGQLGILPQTILQSLLLKHLSCKRRLLMPNLSKHSAVISWMVWVSILMALCLMCFVFFSS